MGNYGSKVFYYSEAEVALDLLGASFALGSGDCRVSCSPYPSPSPPVAVAVCVGVAYP